MGNSFEPCPQVHKALSKLATNLTFLTYLTRPIGPESFKFDFNILLRRWGILARPDFIVGLQLLTATCRCFNSYIELRIQQVTLFILNSGFEI